MARSHSSVSSVSYLIAVLASAGVLSGAVVACGDSVTGGDDTATPTNEAGVDGGQNSKDSSVVIPPTQDSGLADSSKPDSAAQDGGAPTVSTATLDFMQVDCGKTAPTQSFTIQNPSNDAVTWSGALGKAASSAFDFAPSSGSIPAGQSVVVTVTPKPVPASTATADNALGDILTLSLGSTTATVTLKETAHGAILFFSPSTVPFGNTPLAAGAVTSSFTLANSGNATVTATLAEAGDPAFAIVGPTSIMAVSGLTGSSVSFTPTAKIAYAGTISATVLATDPLCAPLPTALGLSGTGTDGIVSISTPQITFGNNGLVDCGATAAPQTVSITNSSAASITYTATLGKGTSLYTLTPSAFPVTIAANSSVNLIVTPKQIPATSSTVLDAFSDQLTITTAGAAGDSPHIIPLHQTAHGVVLTRSTNSLGFSSVAVGRTASSQISYSNQGNVDITLALANGLTEFVQPTPVTISAQSFSAPQLITFTPSSIQPFSDVGTLMMSPTVPLCAALPSTLSLSGTGVAPSLSATPPSFNFGFVLCGTTAQPTVIKITNNGAATTYNATLEKGAARFSVSPASGPITAGGFVLLTVTPTGIPQASPVTSNFFGDTMDVTSGNGNISVGLTETAQGAIIDYNGHGTVAFGTTVKNGSTVNTNGTITVRNTGNLDAAVTFSTTGLPTNVFSSSVPSTTITASTSPTVDVLFSPPGPGTQAYTGTWFATTSTVLCAAIPNALNLTGTGIP